MITLLFDGPERADLLPFTYIRPVAHIRLGIDRLIDKWEAALSQKCGVFTQDYLQKKFPHQSAEKILFINPCFMPTHVLANQILALKENEALIYNAQLVACVSLTGTPPSTLEGYEQIKWTPPLLHLKQASDLFLLNALVLEDDFIRLTKGRTSAPISKSNRVIGRENVFIEEGASVECSILNASNGSIYIGKQAVVMEGSMLRGNLAIGDNSIVKMGTKIYGGTTLGPFSKVGGELNNVVMFGYSNKGHDGFLGNAVLGEWCNIGAATDASNLKNNYAKIRLWNYKKESFLKTELQFCGLLMGDYSRCSIHTTFNTATVVGVSANLFGVGFPRNFIPSFSYGGAQGLSTFTFDKALESAQAMMARKQVVLSETDQAILAQVFEISSQWRKA
ncbi:MAG: putative sugar nucleotidyl transferase [Flavobacteriaceae bacterium]